MQTWDEQEVWEGYRYFIITSNQDKGELYRVMAYKTTFNRLRLATGTDKYVPQRSEWSPFDEDRVYSGLKSLKLHGREIDESEVALLLSL